MQHVQRYNLYLAQMVHAALPGKYFHPAFCVPVRYLIINAGKCMYLLKYFCISAVT